MSEIFTLSLKNNLTKAEYTIDNLSDEQISRIWYAFDIWLPNGMADGEYSYVLTDGDGNIKGTGLMQVGDYVPEKQSYQDETIKENNGFITYNG